MDTVTELPKLDLKVVPERADAGTVTAVIDGEPQEIIGFTPAEARKLIAYEIALKHNSDAALQAVKVLDALEVERRALIEAGRGIEREANYLNRRLAETEKQLDKEKWQHSLDNFINRLLQIGLAVLVVL